MIESEKSHTPKTSFNLEGPRPLEGRSEKRIALEIHVYLVRATGRIARERVSTVNVSRGGARVASKSDSQPGEIVDLAIPSRGLHLPARVIYCEQVSSCVFYMGLKMEEPDLPGNWWED